MEHLASEHLAQVDAQISGIATTSEIVSLGVELGLLQALMPDHLPPALGFKPQAGSPLSGSLQYALDKTYDLSRPLGRLLIDNIDPTTRNFGVREIRAHFAR